MVPGLEPAAPGSHPHCVGGATEPVRGLGKREPIRPGPNDARELGCHALGNEFLERLDDVGAKTRTRRSRGLIRAPPVTGRFMGSFRDVLAPPAQAALGPDGRSA